MGIYQDGDRIFREIKIAPEFFSYISSFLVTIVTDLLIFSFRIFAEEKEWYRRMARPWENVGGNGDELRRIVSFRSDR